MCLGKITYDNFIIFLSALWAESLSEKQVAYILRLNSDEIERKLFLRKWLYVGLKRSWTSGSKVLFANRTEAIIGSGIVFRLQQLDELDVPEKALCIQRNWYAKMYFEILASFFPSIPLNNTPIVSENPLALHGLEVSIEVAAAIEELGKVRIFT